MDLLISNFSGGDQTLCLRLLDPVRSDPVPAVLHRLLWNIRCNSAGVQEPPLSLFYFRLCCVSPGAIPTVGYGSLGWLAVVREAGLPGSSALVREAALLWIAILGRDLSVGTSPGPDSLVQIPVT